MCIRDSTWKEYDWLADLVEIIDDAGKHDNGNNAAGTRVRKEMQSIKLIAQEIRTRVQSDKNKRK